MKDFEQLGGFSDLKFYLSTDVSNWPIVLNDTTSNQLVLNSNNMSNLGVITDSSIEVVDTPKQSAEGIVYPIDISFTFSNRTKALEQFLDSYQNQSVVVFCKLNTGDIKLYGSDQEPLQFLWKVIDGKKAEDLGVVSVSIKGDMRNRPVYYSA
jgi:hypothetical protein